ncbi:transcriptional regulator [Bradyrhizobium genosp. P]|uniref:WYL domain-containing protein n=1 Tax=Bradyrhizobium genosp. P TaxID=83641 RepID=UPI003CF88DB1
MSNQHESKRRWGADQRLEFIEFRLFWDGKLNRGDIVDRFNVSPTQASADLAIYKQAAPQNLDYDASQKCFVATKNFTPTIFQPNADRYLVQLKAIADQVISLSDTGIGRMPTIDAMPIPHRRVDPNILRPLLRTIRGQRGLRVFYHSMNSTWPLPLWRAITPHAFAFDGLRWHVRAYCHIEMIFKDFILSRILELGEEIEPGKLISEDKHWHEYFDVVLVPNPELTTSQQETIAWDYGMTDGVLHLPVRRALLYYFNKRLRLDVAEKLDDPKERPIVLSNKAEFQRALKQTKI